MLVHNIIGSRTTIKTYRAAGVKNLDSVELSLLGHTVGRGTNCSSDVSAVAVAVSVGAVTGVVGKEGSTTAEVRVSREDSSVNDVGAGVGTRGAVVDVGRRALGDVRDTAKTPGSTSLGGESLLVKRVSDFSLPQSGLYDGILLNVLNLGKAISMKSNLKDEYTDIGKSGDDLDEIIAELTGEALEGVQGVGVGRGAGEQSKRAVDSRCGEVAVLELDNVPSRNDLAGARSDDGSAEHQRQACEGDEVETHLEELSTKKPGNWSEGRW